MPAPLRSVTLGGLARVFLFGAVAGALFDAFHTHSGTTQYARPIVFRMAWWTMPLFGGAYTLLALVYGAARRPDQRSPEGARRAAGLVSFGALYFASGFLPASNAVKLV